MLRVFFSVFNQEINNLVCFTLALTVNESSQTSLNPRHLADLGIANGDFSPAPPPRKVSIPVGE
jgi:hypothetical protein